MDFDEVCVELSLHSNQFAYVFLSEKSYVVVRDYRRLSVVLREFNVALEVWNKTYELLAIRSWRWINEFATWVAPNSVKLGFREDLRTILTKKPAGLNCTTKNSFAEPDVEVAVVDMWSEPLRVCEQQPVCFWMLKIQCRKDRLHMLINFDASRDSERKKGIV